MVTVAGPRRNHTGFLCCAVFDGWSPNRTPSRSIASRSGEDTRRIGLPTCRGYAHRHGHPSRRVASSAHSRSRIGRGAASGRQFVSAYEKDSAEIYRQSFAMIRANADLSRFSTEESQVAVRMIHACGMVDLARDIAFSPRAVVKARAALAAGAPILCDVQMVASGVTRRRLPADNEVLCTLSDPRVAHLAREIGNTRTAASVELWRDHLDGAVVAIGNAPTALFHLLELLRDTDIRPAAILGIPVGFIGAVESKRALADNGLGLDYIVVHGRRGGSAITCGALNAIASEDD